MSYTTLSPSLTWYVATSVINHKYADGIQLSKGAPPNQFQSLLCDIQTCTESLVGWMYSNKLELNAENTKVFPFASTMP